MSHLYKPNYNEWTSKNRLKVSDYTAVFFNTFQYGIETDVWDQELTNGGTATHNPNTNNVDLTVTSTLGSKVVRQTKNVMRYIPGRTSTLSYAIRMDEPVEGIRRRFGMFETEDGVFFEDAGIIGDSGLPEYNVVVRSNVTGTVLENRIPRSQWNGDKLDGTGPSGITADPTAQHLVNIEYEWYGAGQVIFSFVINGRNHVVHTFNHANNITIPWSSTPFLPIRLEIENLTGVDGTHTLHQGSNSLISEGTPEKLGISANITAPITGTTLTTAYNWYPVLSIRLKSDSLKGIALPTFAQVATIDNANIFYKLVKNATIGTGGNGWTDHPNPDAFTQYQTYTTPSAIQEADEGTAINSGFVIGGNGTNIKLDRDTVYQIGRSNLGTTSDTLTLLCTSNTSNKEALASLTWIEQR